MSGMSAPTARRTLLERRGSRPRAGCAFAGDGGGEVFGFLLMKARAGQLLNEGKVREAVDSYSQQLRALPQALQAGGIRTDPKRRPRPDGG